MPGASAHLGLAAAAVLLQGQAPPARPAPAEAGSPILIGRSYVVPSAVLQGTRRVNVYLPPHYGAPRRRFPVLFLLDGGADEDFHHITGLVAISSAYGTTEEMIVVGIEGVDRRHDLTSASSDPDDLKVAPTSGGAAAYRRFLVDELQPWVAAHYGQPARTVLIGESLAGLFALETALREPAAFNDYIAVSPSLWWDRQSLSREAAADLAKGRFEGRRLWLASADEGSYSPEMAAATERLVAALKTAAPRGLAWTYTPFPHETHATIYHPAAMAALRALFALPRPAR